MNEPVRRFMEPRDLVDRAIYMIGALFMPWTVVFAIREGLLYAGIVCAVFWVLQTFYTIEWITERLVD